MKKKIEPEELESMGYKMHVHLQHDALMPFVKEHLFSTDLFSVFYWAFNGILTIGIILVFGYSEGKLITNFDEFCLGFLGFFLLIPIHEVIHGIGYKLAGADKVSYKAVWKKLVFYAMADRFVVSRIPFTLLAIAPFTIINIFLIVLWFILPEKQGFAALGTLFLHTAGCSGDFALMAYFHRYRKSEPLTYDNIASASTGFLLKES